MKERNTKQKEIILDILSNSTSHPTIYELYEMTKEKHPKMGQATVYRNVAKLVSMGRIQKITTKDGIDRYDGNITPHIHLHCAVCDKILDILDNDLLEALLKFKDKHNIKIMEYSISLKGICEKCIKNNKEKEK